MKAALTKKQILARLHRAIAEARIGAVNPGYNPYNHGARPGWKTPVTGARFERVRA